MGKLTQEKTINVKFERHGKKEWTVTFSHVEYAYEIVDTLMTGKFLTDKELSLLLTRLKSGVSEGSDKSHLLQPSGKAQSAGKPDTFGERL